ncbi:MAG: hypothetical protein HY658_14370, partial [Actinobacteria bacterium]|nr:hypothetical protein [Actinomycetota bacterium]
MDDRTPKQRGILAGLLGLFGEEEDEEQSRPEKRKPLAGFDAPAPKAAPEPPPLAPRSSPFSGPAPEAPWRAEPGPSPDEAGEPGRTEDWYGFAPTRHPVRPASPQTSRQDLSSFWADDERAPNGLRAADHSPPDTRPTHPDPRFPAAHP